MQRSQAQLRAVLALSGWVALAATQLPGGSPLRWIPVLLFVAFCPGLAVFHPQPRGSLRGARIEALALAAPLSPSLAVLDSTALFLVQAFSVTVFLGSLAAFCTVVALLPGVPLPASVRRAAGRARAGTGKSEPDTGSAGSDTRRGESDTGKGKSGTRMNS